jgi:uncharacterized spore protein YtfJ
MSAKKPRQSPEAPLPAAAAHARPIEAGRRRLVALRRLVDRIGGARLCYGQPVRQGERTVIPVARVRAIGGGGFGRGGDAGGELGGGGGGRLDALPVGFIDIGPEGARFEPIPDPEATVRLVRTAATAAATLVGAVAGLRATRRGGLLRRGR